MYCDECKKRPPSVHVTKIINGQKYESKLCAECAQKQQEFGSFQSSLVIPNFLAALFNFNNQLEAQEAQPQTDPCPKCGITFEEITKSGRLGCNECYAQFADKLEPLLRRIHGSAQHLGKVPLRSGGFIRQKKQIDQLRTQMQQMITREEFEQAAQIRDQIRSLEQGLGE